jgi:tetratricopeptide (TPR) repeat protein
MMRPGFAVLGAAVLVVVWCGLIAVQTNGDVAAALASLGDSAQRARLPGLAAKAYLMASVQERRRLQSLDRTSPAAEALVQRIITRRLAAARTLLDAGQVAAAERVALEGARADYGDVQARALLLEIRLRGRDPEAARRELMLTVLQGEHPQLLALLGRAFADLNRPADAESFYRRALTRDPAHVASLLGMAQVAAARGDANAVTQWLGQAAAAAERPDEKRAVARLRPLAGSRWTRATAAVAAFGSEHCGSLLFALAYLAFLFSPTAYGFLRGLSAPGRAVAGMAAVLIAPR